MHNVTDYELSRLENNCSDEHDKCEFRAGEFIARVEPQDGLYAFRVRDLRRERPTIHGFERGYEEAVFAAKQVMAALGTRS